MHKSHPVFAPPTEANIKIWRYMDLTKLISILSSRRLFFSRADKLGDPFEGSWPRLNVEARSMIPPQVPAESHSAYLQAMSQMSDVSKDWPKCGAVSCWHMSEYESAAMWKLYLKSDEGIAIQSRYSSLCNALIDEQTIYVGVVKYIDYDSEFIRDPGNSLSPFVHKRKSFEHEREIRALIFTWPPAKYGSIDDGIAVKVDLESLIERIYVAPSSPRWFLDLVTLVVRQFNYNFPVFQSELSSQPVY